MHNLRGLLALTLERTRASWITIVVAGGIAGLLIVGAGLLTRANGFGLRELTQDATWTAGVPFYYGSLGAAGILCWWTGGVICLFAAALLGPGGARPARFLLCSGLFTLLLAVDDQLQIHEFVIPVYLGIGEPWVYGTYALLAAAYLIAFYRVILATDFPLLGAAAACLAFSIGVDALILDMPGHHLLEDGSKLVGIVFWTVYFIRTSLAMAREPAAAAFALPPLMPSSHRNGAAKAAAELRPVSRV